MTELLAPAGNWEALKAAIANGCDAIYLGMQKFGARAYSTNFDAEQMKEAVDYAHLRGVKIYVTMNTIVFEDELAEMREQLELLNDIGVDGVIVQDLAVFDYIVKNFADMEAHCSTQMGLDDLEGTMLMKELGARRAVLSRELPIDEVKRIKAESGLPIEIFVHGALCVSYSGNCLMSGLIGYRSGNRGRCVGSCRKPYELINTTTGESLGESYILSTKDLNTVEHIEDLKSVDSLKIEGRMKEPAYVANVVSTYRKAIDGSATADDKYNLCKTFNRTFTKGYLFGEDKRDISNIMKPNNFGYEVGYISGYKNGRYEIKLSKTLNQNDIIRIDHNNEDVNLTAVKLFDRNGRLTNSADDFCSIQIQEKLRAGDKVYVTKDLGFYKSLETHIDGDYRKSPISFRVYAYPGSKLVVDAEGLGQHVLYESEEILEEAANNPTDLKQVRKQLARLGDTVFELKDIEFEEFGAFIPAKMLNSARRFCVDSLYESCLEAKPRARRENVGHEKIAFAPKEPKLTAQVRTREQYEACRAAGIDEIYYENIVRRNENVYTDREGELLIGGYGGAYRYRDTNEWMSDYSFNVTNSVAVYELHKLGAKRVTLSYEINIKQLKDLVDGYTEANGGAPALEMVVYGRAPLMFTKYCPLKKMGQCGTCRECSFEIRDEHGSFPVISHEDCTTTILNGKILNLLDEMPSIEGVEAFRLNFTIEDAETTAEVCRAALDKLSGNSDETLFNQATDTRGHYNKEII